MFNGVSHVLVHSKCLFEKKRKDKIGGRWPWGQRTCYIQDKGKLLASWFPSFSPGANIFMLLEGSSLPAAGTSLVRLPHTYREVCKVLFLLPSVLSSSTPPLFKKKKKKKHFTEVLYNQFQPDLSLVYVLVAKSSSYFSTSFVWRRAAEQRCTVSLSPAFWV